MVLYIFVGHIAPNEFVHYRYSNDQISGPYLALDPIEVIKINITKKNIESPQGVAWLATPQPLFHLYRLSWVQPGRLVYPKKKKSIESPLFTFNPF